MMDAEFYFNRGVEKSLKKDLQGAIEDYSVAIILSSGTVKKTITTKLSDNCTESVDVFEICEGNESMYFNRGCAFLDLGNYIAALNDFSKFIEYNQKDAEVYFKRAIALYCLKDDNDAYEDLKAATALDPKYNLDAFFAIFRG